MSCQEGLKQKKKKTSSKAAEIFLHKWRHGRNRAEGPAYLQKHPKSNLIPNRRVLLEIKFSSMEYLNLEALNKEIILSGATVKIQRLQDHKINMVASLKNTKYSQRS